MPEQEGYNGWANRETWALALWIDNDQGWQERMTEVVGDAVKTLDTIDARSAAAGQAVKEDVEETLIGEEFDNFKWQRDVLHDIGSLYRVDWDEIGTYYVSGLDES